MHLNVYQLHFQYTLPCTAYITTVGLKIIKKSLILKFDSVFSKISVRKFQLLKVGKIC